MREETTPHPCPNCQTPVSKIELIGGFCPHCESPIFKASNSEKLLARIFFENRQFNNRPKYQTAELIWQVLVGVFFLMIGGYQLIIATDGAPMGVTNFLLSMIIVTLVLRNFSR